MLKFVCASLSTVAWRCMGEWRNSSKHFNTWGVVNWMAHLLTPWGRISSVWV